MWAARERRRIGMITHNKHGRCSCGKRCGKRAHSQQRGNADVAWVSGTVRPFKLQMPKSPAFEAEGHAAFSFVLLPSGERGHCVFGGRRVQLQRCP